MKDGFQLTGQSVQGYKISKPIGQGKFSIVYKAQNEQGIPFALKKIKIFDMADQKQRQKCLKQVDLMKALNHPNIIQYIDSFIHNNELIIVQQWADKGDLKKLIREHEQDEVSFEQSVIWRYMKQISSALMHMHEKRIMHRDLKPANIFIGHDYTLKIGDLGLGRSFSSQTLQAYSKVGTPLYMSPQLIQDSGYNQNADVWSLGCIIYQLCELNSPFRNKKQKMSLMDLFDNITKCNYKPISSRYSQQLSQAIKSMIVVDPSKRFSSQQVYQLACKMMQNSNKPKLDPIITMDDIYVKLQLMDYVNMFCKVAEKKPIHRYYFAIKDMSSNKNQQLFYFLQLAYWIMHMSKTQQQNKKQKLPLYSKTMIDWKSPQNACIKFISDLNNYGVKTENIQMVNILQGYGQYVCYLLNQVLNRELIRSNFQFREPRHNGGNDDNKLGTITNIKQADDTNDNTNTLDQIDEQQKQFNLLEQQFQCTYSLKHQHLEQNQFQQSIFFNKNQRRDKNIHGELLEKIQQFDNQDDKIIIYSKINQKQWRLECERLGKQFNQMTQKAKLLRKKGGYQNFQTAKISSSKLTDLIHFVKPASVLLVKKIDDDLDIIKASQQQINSKFKTIVQERQDVTNNLKELSNKQYLLQGNIRQRHQQLEKMQEKITQIDSKIKNNENDSENTNTRGKIKQAIATLQKQIIQMQQKKGIILWQLTKLKCNNLKRQDSDFLNKLKNQHDLEQF